MSFLHHCGIECVKQRLPISIWSYWTKDSRDVNINMHQTRQDRNILTRAKTNCSRASAPWIFMLTYWTVPQDLSLSLPCSTRVLDFDCAKHLWVMVSGLGQHIFYMVDSIDLCFTFPLSSALYRLLQFSQTSCHLVKRCLSGSRFNMYGTICNFAIGLNCRVPTTWLLKLTSDCEPECQGDHQVTSPFSN